MRERFAIMVGVMTLAVAMAAVPAGADDHVYQANLTTGAEVHEVAGSNATGHATFWVADDGIGFTLKANRLSGPVWGAHIHGPAGPDANAGIVVGLCGAPPVAPAPTCTMTKDGKLRVDGVITHDVLDAWGTSAEALLALMDEGLTYVNVHTDLNPPGEVRGQIR
jgi:hypothetical protein